MTSTSTRNEDVDLLSAFLLKDGIADTSIGDESSGYPTTAIIDLGKLSSGTSAWRGLLFLRSGSLLKKVKGGIFFGAGATRGLQEAGSARFETSTFIWTSSERPDLAPIGVSSYVPAHSSELDYFSVSVFDVPNEPMDWLIEPDDDFRSAIAALKRLVAKLEKEPLSWGPQEGERLTAQTSRNAQRFLDLLPSDRKLPKVAPDGDGGLYMAWEKHGEPTVVVGVGDDRLFAVVNPGTPESLHISETAFDGVSIPPEILSVIPTRS